MKETLVLSKILLKNALNKGVNTGKSKVKAIATNIILFLAVAYIACVVAFLSKELIDVLKTVNQPTIFLSLCLMLTVAVSLIRSIISSLNLLYFSKDIEYLLPLPMSALKIVFAKFNVLIISSYILEIFSLAIPFVVYGIYMYKEPIFYIMSVLIFIFLPIIPTLISVLISAILIKFTGIIKNKDIVQYITVFIAIAFGIAIQIFAMNNSEITEFMLANKLQEVDGIARMIADYVIIVKQAFLAITEFDNLEYIKNAIFLVGETVTAYVLIGLFTSKTYIKSATNITSGKKAKKTKFDVSKRSILKAYVDKELKMLFRTPGFFLNTVLPVFLFPILFTLPFIDPDMANDAEDISMFISIVSDNVQNTMGLATFLCAMLLLFVFNFTSVTSISRDGENAIVMKYLPVDLHIQCRYKSIPGFLLNLFPTLLIIAGIKFILSANNIFVLEVLLIGLLLNMFVSYFGVFIDIINPKLHWTTEYSVVKQNMNMLWYILFMLIVGFIIFGICSYFENVHIATMCLSGIIIITTVFYDKFLKQNNINIFKKIS